MRAPRTVPGPVGAATVNASDPLATLVPLRDALDQGPTEWDRLLESSPVASPFATWAWHRAWANAAPPADLAASQVVMLRGADGTLQAVLPVAVRTATFRRRRTRVLTWAIGDVGCPDHLEVPALPDAELAAVIPALTSLPWDVAILSNLAPEAPNAMRLAAAFANAGCTVRRQALWSCPYLDLPATWEDYLASLSPTRRQRLRRCERNLERDHAVTLTDYGAERLDEGWQQLVSLHQQRWAGAGVFGDPQVERLHRSFLRELVSSGRLWLTTLELDGQPAAAWYGFTDRDTVHFYQSGRDPRWEDQSVGVALMAVMIRRAIERGYRRFDFLRGDETYKALWTASQRVTVELVIFRPGWRGLWLRGLDLAALLRARMLGHRAGDDARGRAAHA
jgi:CelD/BcsL family acetyltransferase involved in cellulose biosynthesis